MYRILRQNVEVSRGSALFRPGWTAIDFLTPHIFSAAPGSSAKNAVHFCGRVSAALMERINVTFRSPAFLFSMQPSPSTSGKPLPLVQGAGDDLLLASAPDPQRQGFGAAGVSGRRREAGMMQAEDDLRRHGDPQPGHEPRQQYGVLPWRIDRRGNLRVMLITSRRRTRWIVPRGWPVKGRAPFMSAALEAFEEAGIIGDIRPTPLTHFHYLKEEGDGPRELRVTLFGMEVRGTLSHWRERDERQRRWFSLEEAADRLGDVELARFVRQLAAEPGRLTDRRGSGQDAAGPDALAELACEIA